MMRRLFIAVDLSSDVKEILRGVQARPQFNDLRVRWTPPEQMHCTLVFLGATDERQVAPISQAITAAVAGRAPFRLSLAGLGAFPESVRPKVVWCGVDGDTEQLRQLREAIAATVAPVAALTDAGSYTPHLTIGRVRRDAHAPERRMVGDAIAHADALAPCEWVVDHVVLYESVPSASGVRHVPLVTAPLRGVVSL